MPLPVSEMYVTGSFRIILLGLGDNDNFSGSFLAFFTCTVSSDSESAYERKIKQNFERNIIQYVFKVVNVKQFFKAPWKHIPSALLTGYFYPVLSLCISFLLPQIIANLMA